MFVQRVMLKQMSQKGGGRRDAGRPSKAPGPYGSTPRRSEQSRNPHVGELVVPNLAVAFPVALKDLIPRSSDELRQLAGGAIDRDEPANPTLNRIGNFHLLGGAAPA